MVSFERRSHKPILREVALERAGPLIPGSATARESSPIKDVRHASELVIDYALPNAGLHQKYSISASLTGRTDLAQFTKKAASPESDFCEPQPTLTSRKPKNGHLKT